MSELTVISGAGGGKSGGGGSRTPVEDPNTLRSKNVARIVDVIGEGPIHGLVDGTKSIYLEETPLENADGSFNFSGVLATGRAGYPDQAEIPGFPAVEVEVPVNTEVRNDTPVVRSINNSEVDAVRVKVQLGGLSRQNKENGDLKGYHVDFAFDVRYPGDTSWRQLAQRRISGKTMSPYQEEYRFDLDGDGPWEIRMRRISSDDPGAHIRNDTTWVSFTEVIDAKLTYPDTALVAMQIDAQQFGTRVPSRAYHVRGRIIDVPTNYDPVNRSYSGLWNGQFKKSWTDNPAWVYYDIARNERFGAGHKHVDKWALYEIARYCDQMVPNGYGGQEPRFTCNLVIHAQEDAHTVLNSLASVFRGMVYWASDTAIPVADMPRDASKLFTPANVVGGDFSYSGASLKSRHSAALVSWNDPDDFFRQTVEVVEDRELVQKFGWKTKDVTAFGCSSRGQAYRLGKWILYTEKFETETVTFTAGSDAYDLRPGDVIKVSDPTVSGARLGGRLLTTGTASLQLDASPDEASGNSWTLDVMMPSGGVESRKVNQFQLDHYLTLEQPLSQEPEVGAMWLLRSQSVEPRTFRVLDVSEREGLEFEVTALEHRSGKYALVEQGIELPQISDSLLPTGPVSGPMNITVETFTYLAGGAEHQGMEVSWTASDDPRVEFYSVELKGPSEADWESVYRGPRLSVTQRDIEAGEWQVRVRAYTGTNRPSAWVYRTTNVVGLLIPSPPTAVDVVAGTFDIALRPQGLIPGAQWEFWRANAPLQLEEIESNAVRVAVGTDLLDNDLQPATLYFYWIRGVNVYGVSAWYPVQVETKKDFEKIMEVISGEIYASDLYVGLGERIALIDAPDSVSGSVNERLEQARQELLTRVDGTQSQLSLDLEQARQELLTRVDGTQTQLSLDLEQARQELSDRVSQERDERVAAITAEQGARGAAILAEGETRASADEALAEDIASLTAVVDGVSADIFTEQQARADADSALAEQVQVVSAQLGETKGRVGDMVEAAANEKEASALRYQLLQVNDAAKAVMIRTEEVSRITEDEALAQRITTLQAEVGDEIQAAVQSEQLARATADEALASDISALQVQVGEEISAAITSLSEATADQFGAVASDLSLLEAKAEGDLSAAMQTAAQARASLEEALSTEITQLEARVGDEIASAVQVEATARATDVSSLSGQITTVQSSLEGQVSSVQQSLTTEINSVKGTLNSEYTLKLDNNGLVGGMGIVNDGSMVDFAIRADRFYVSNTTGSVKSLPFVVSGNSVYIQDAVIRDAAITTAKIADAAITQAKIAGDLHVAGASTFTGTAQSTNFPNGGWRLQPGGGFILRSSSTGARLNMSGDRIEVYDSSRLRVRIGRL